MQLWIDVEDMFVHADHGRRRVSGIQRVVLELCRALRLEAARNEGPSIRLVRHDPWGTDYYEVDWTSLAALFGEPEPVPAPVHHEMKLAAPPPARIEHGPPPQGPARGAVHRLVRRVPPSVRVPFARAVYAQRDSLRTTWHSVLQILRAMEARRSARFARIGGVARAARHRAPRAQFASGDTLLSAGAGWIFADHARRIAAARASGVGLTLLVHDIIPIRRPEFTGIAARRAFEDWFSSLAPQADVLLTVSRSSADDLDRWARSAAIAVPAAAVLPMGTPDLARSAASLVPLQPPIERYALTVATIEARKNQAFLVRVWRRLIEEISHDAVPLLVLAGHVGGNVHDMMAELDGTEFLDGKIRIVADPADDALVRMYCGCWFTVFPSLYEGWGLPVTESLAFGKPCLAARTTSVPEAGGLLVRYFDPECVADAARAIRSVIENPEGVAAWSKQIEREFQPTPWRDTARALIDAIAVAH